jgi:predicted nucleotidyltransferase
MEHASDWIIQRHILRERGVVITGPDPKALIDPISPDDLRQAVVDVLPLWVEPILEDPSQINKRGYQSFFVLSICRVFYTLKYGEIVSKKFAAEWAKANLDERWRSLIERAWIGRQNPRLEAQPEDISETLEMMRYVLQKIQPTPYPDVNEVLNLLLAEVQNILGDQFVGLYLYGSLSSGEFDPASSDIDFLVVTTDMLPEKTIADLEAMQQRIWKMGLKWADKLEGSYLPKAHLRRYEKSDIAYPTVNEHKFYVAPHGSDWIIQRHIVREQGVVLAGPDPKSLIDPVSPDDIRRAVRGILQEWWFPMLEDPSWLKDHGGEVHAFAILTMCRSLCALERGKAVSKPVAAKWAQQALGDKWSGVIEQALVVRKGEEDFDLSVEALELIRYTMERVNIIERKS